MRKLLFIILASFCLNGFSQFYPFDSIPATLKKGADAVVRTAQCLYTVTEPGKAVQKIRTAVTLLNEDADPYRYLTVFYDNNSKVNYIKGNIYDEKGNIVRSLGASNVFDMSAITGGSFYTDDRMKVMRFPLYRYPYTIEYEYEVSFSGIYTYPLWNFQESRNISVEESGIQFVIPSNLKFRFYEQSLKNKVDSAVLGPNKIYTWMEENIPASSWYSPLSIYTSMPSLNTAPLEFEYSGTRGSMVTWKTYGQWFYNINKDRDILSEQEITEVKNITSKFPDQKDKIKAIYQYMQSRTRYVSIQIGIGGFQSAPATAVSSNGFGDCKALVNYTKALLKAAGIESNFVLVKAGEGERDINTSFIDNQFNHVILCVPDRNDSTWLECTNQNLPFNYLGGFTCDRHALFITPEGGVIVKTPGYNKSRNLIERKGTLFFNTAGTSSARINETYKGYYFGDFSSLLSSGSEDELKKLMYSSLEYPDFTVTSAEYTEDKTAEPSGHFQYQVSIKSFGATNGRNIYFAPSISKEDFLQQDTVSIKIIVDGVKVDSLTYWIPPNYKVELKPEDVSLESEFGKYTYRTVVSGEKLILYRRLELQKQIIPASKYTDFRNFYNDIARSDRNIVVLSKT